MIVTTNGTSPFGRLVVRLASGTSELIWLAGDGRFAPAAMTDYAKAAAIVLTDHRPGSRTLPLSGPLALTAFGVASAFSQVLGEEVRFREVDAADLDVALTGASPEVAGEMDSIYDDTSRGEWPAAGRIVISATRRGGAWPRYQPPRS